MKSSSILSYPLNTGDTKTGTLANSEDPDEMPHNAALHQGLHCLLRQNRSSEKEIKYISEIITCGPSLYTTDKLTLLYGDLWKIPMF